jgi:mannose-1-phosphate guanylyltransferase
MLDLDHDSAHDWAIVLTRSCGARLSSLTGAGAGPTLPLFWPRCGQSLGETIALASRVVSPGQVVVVVDSESRTAWSAELADLPRQNVIMQPCDRGTGPGILLPLLSILERDQVAHVALFPVGPFAAQDHVVVASVRRALANSHRMPGPLELIGFAPDRHHRRGQHWILPGRPGGETRSVQQFVAGPNAAGAAELRVRGGVWCPCLLAARAISIVGLYQLRLPDLVGPFLQRGLHADRSVAAEMYGELPVLDFAHDLLAGSEPCLRLRIVPRCAVATARQATASPRPERARLHEGAV